MCPYCDNYFTPTEQNKWNNQQHITISYNQNEFDESLYLENTVIACPNPDCRKLIVESSINAKDSNGYFDSFYPLKSFKVLPDYTGKSYPEYVPGVIREDYEEARKIIDKSPKAAATLLRRCIQNMIRNKWKITKTKLYDEIEALEEHSAASPEIITALHDMREIGNLGAHMMLDSSSEIPLEVTVEEAEIMSDMVEELITEWYVNPHERNEKLKKLSKKSKEVSESRKSMKKTKSQTGESEKSS